MLSDILAMAKVCFSVTPILTEWVSVVPAHVLVALFPPFGYNV